MKEVKQINKKYRIVKSDKKIWFEERILCYCSNPLVQIIPPGSTYNAEKRMFCFNGRVPYEEPFGLKLAWRKLS